MCHGCYAEEKNGSAASELRCRCAWLHHGSGPRARRIQGCGAIDPRPKASSPLIAIPTAPSVPSCSEQSRYGLARTEHAARLVRRPTLTAPARDDMGEARVGTKERLSDRTKELGGAPACRNSLTRKAPYKAQAAPTARPKVPMRRLGADCFVVALKRGNARGAKGAGHRHLARVNWCWVQPTPGGTRCSMEGGSLRAMARAG